MVRTFFIGKSGKRGGLPEKLNEKYSSSVLALLALISENERQNTAFAFLDEGSYGERGLEVLRDSAKRKATIYYLILLVPKHLYM